MIERPIIKNNKIKCENCFGWVTIANKQEGNWLCNDCSKKFPGREYGK